MLTNSTRRLALGGIAVLVTGCAAPLPQLTRDEYLAMSSRVLPAPKEQVIAAAEKVLRLSDREDYAIHHQKNGFSAQRRWSVYLVLAAAMGTDFWVVRVDERPDGSRIEVEIGTSSQAITPMMTTTPGTWSVNTLPANAAPVTGPALYELYFERIKYLLGLRPEWPTCAWSDERVKTKQTWGINEALCNSFNVADDSPSEPSVNAKPIARTGPESATR